MMRCAVLIVSIAATLPGYACAQDFDVHGYADLRLVVPPNERSWADGGLGKLRYGDGGKGEARFGGAALAGTLQMTPEILAVADVRYQTTGRASLDLIEAYVRYRPVSLTPWRWSLKLGAFHPPVSFENDGVGWSSRWTLTPSAINSWMGEEFRCVGAEVRIEHRGEINTYEAAAGVFGGNDPAGELLAARGWSLSDLTYGFGSRVREPDVYAVSQEFTPPLRYNPFQEIDDRIGWYAELSLRSREYGRLSLMRYDNNADPHTSTPNNGGDLFTWDTYFWSLGAETRIRDVVLIAQLIDGNTAIKPSPFFQTNTEYQAGYLLAAWNHGTWRPALRVDFFGTQQRPNSIDARTTEHGSAVTFALNWRPREWLRVTGEVLRVDSTRSDRSLAGLSPHSVDTQVQINTRFQF